ncbi:MAG: hypothetical protein WCQ38_06560, partial [Synergistaceae bacterium]
PGTFHELSPSRIFESSVFNRVSLQICTNPQTLGEFAQSLDLSNVSSALFVMNTKQSAIDLYNILKQRFSDKYQVYCLTTLNIPYCRLKRIQKVRTNLKNGKRVILVSTQLVEAGVDLSFQRVYRDIGPLDSIIQVAGRCNRHGEFGELGGVMQVVSLHKDGKKYNANVYDNYLLQKTDEAISDRKQIESNQFADIIQEYYRSIQFGAESQAIMKAIGELNYDQSRRNQLSINEFRLIQDQYNTVSLYILLNEEAQQTMEELISAKEILDQTNIGDEAISHARLAMKKCYHFLSKYQLNLSESDIKNYSIQNSYFNKFKDKVYYIPLVDIEKAYNCETGFLKVPLESGSVMAL